MPFFEQNQSKRALDESLKGGFYFHPSDEDLSPGAPVTTPSSKDRSPGASTKKKPLEGSAIGYSYSDFAIGKEYISWQGVAAGLYGLISVIRWMR
jgi:hypothetical protein